MSKPVTRVPEPADLHLAPAGNRGRKFTRRPWSAEELAVVREQYADRPTPEIAVQINRTVSQVYQAAGRLGLAKSEAVIAAQNEAKRGKSTPQMRAHQFRKGQTPPNKGLRRPGWAPGRMAETQFRRGEMAGAARAKWKPIGTIMPDTEGYLRIKLRERVPGANEHGWNSKIWKLYHHVVWEQANGPIPPKHILVFRDRDRSNCAIENLELISMAENARRNHYKNSLPPELAKAVQLAGALKRKIRNREEKLSGKKQDG